MDCTEQKEVCTQAEVGAARQGCLMGAGQQLVGLPPVLALPLVLHMRQCCGQGVALCSKPPVQPACLPPLAAADSWLPDPEDLLWRQAC